MSEVLLRDVRASDLPILFEHYGHVAKHNVASRRVLEKCGFTISGEDREFSKTGGSRVEGLILRLEA